MKALSMIIGAVPSDVDHALELIELFCQHEGLNQKSLFEVKVVLAESLGNAIKHGLRGGSHRDKISITCKSDGRQITITTRDKGIPLKKEPGFEFPAADSQNGRGWPIIFNWMDNVEYNARRGINYLKLTKFLRPLPANQ